MAKRKVRYFQWVDGELKGNITTLVNITEFDGEYFYNFDDGEVCNLRMISPMTNNPDDIRGKFVVEILSPAYAWKVETISTHKERVYDAEKGEISIEVPPIEDVIAAGGQQEVELKNSAVGKIKIIPPTKCPVLEPLPELSDYLVNEDTNNIAESETKVEVEPITNNTDNVVSEQVVQSSSSIEYIDDPVYLLVKNCKKHNTPIVMTVNIDLPKRSIYVIADEEFENGGTKFIDYLVSQIDVQNIKSALRAALVGAYKNN
jgi:hypothetical protein